MNTAITLASVLVLAVIFLWANTVAGKAVSKTPADASASATTAKAPLRALYACGAAATRWPWRSPSTAGRPRPT